MDFLQIDASIRIGLMNAAIPSYTSDHRNSPVGASVEVSVVLTKVRTSSILASETGFGVSCADPNVPSRAGKQGEACIGFF